MPRPRKPRICICPHRAGCSAVFKPAGIPFKDMEMVQLAHDELEVLHLCDGEGPGWEHITPFTQQTKRRTTQFTLSMQVSDCGWRLN